MEITLSHLIGLALSYFGVHIFVKGEVEVEYGMTNGNRGKFISSKKVTVKGNAAKLKGLAFVILGICTALFLPTDQVFFTL